jgi:hypothetical protein
MSYIGQQPVVGRYILLDQISGGFNGTATGFTMAAGGQGVLPGLAQNVLLSLGGVIQQPGVDYLISGSGLTFTTAPVSGTTFFATVLGDMQAVGTPSDGTVLPASIASSGTFVFPNVTTTGTTLIASGTAAAPSLAVIGDVNTGLYSPGTDQLAVSTGGTGRLFVDASGNVEVGAASNLGSRLGVTTSSASVLGLYRTAVGEARLSFYNNNASSTAALAARVGGLLTDATAGAEAGALLFSTTNAGASGERMRLDSSGRLGLGTSPDRLLHVSAADTAYIRLENQDSTGSVDQYVGLIEFEGQDTGGSGVRAQIGAIYEGVSGATAFAFGTSADGGSVTERLRINRNGNVGIGTTSPGFPLDVNGSGSFTGSMRATSTGTFTVLPAGVSGNWTGSGFALQSEGSTAPIGFLQGSSERLRIDSSGRLLVGTSSAFITNNLSASGGAFGPLQVVATSTANANTLLATFQSLGLGHQLSFATSRGSSVGTIVQSGDTLGRIAFFGDDGTDLVSAGASIVAVVDGTPGADDMPGRLVFSTTADGASTPTERLRITSDGTLRLYNSPGIDFSQIQTNAAGMTSETLDSYEEGTFTPTIVGVTTAGTGTYITQTGRYTKIGNCVRVEININWTAHTGTGAMRISGLPFTSLNVASSTPPMSFYFNNIAMTASNYPQPYISSNSTQVIIAQAPVGGGAATTVPVDTSGGAILIAGVYETAT